MEQFELSVGPRRSPILLTLKQYQGRKIIDIRKFYTDSAAPEKVLPTRKGVSLTGQQFALVLQTLSENSRAISEFFEDGIELRLDSNIQVQTGATNGRLFQFVFENGSTKVVLDNRVSEVLDNARSALMANMLLMMYSALMDTLEDEKEISLVFDSLNIMMSRSL